MSRDCDFCGEPIGTLPSVTEADGAVRHEHCWGLWLDQQLQEARAELERLRAREVELQWMLRRMTSVFGDFVATLATAMGRELEQPPVIPDAEKLLATYRARSTPETGGAPE